MVGTDTQKYPEDMQNAVENIEEYFFKADEGRIYDVVIDKVGRMLIEKALERTRGNRVLASKMLGLNRNTLHAKIKKLHIDVDRFKL
ncbi:MAG: helix-turn-helix domain-containing protein [Candidatus Omnitrophica bacterium]|nr:helix-turn-helix domain-containing protein [Candidatus Omnitrophota bacterium]